MNKLSSTALIVFIAVLTFAGCSSQPDQNNKHNGSDSSKKTPTRLMVESLYNKIKAGSPGGGFFTITLTPVSVNFHVPAIQSFASAAYQNYYVFVGGQKYGFHGTSNNPAPFQATVANDSMWVIDINGMQSWGCKVPAGYEQWLESSNAASCQVDNMLYIAGGYTRSSLSAPRYDMTSSNFLGLSIPNLISYIQSGGTTPVSQVIPINIQNPYVQVTGGEMVLDSVTGYFYLVGGQNYSTVYSSGTTGAYTNAIRRFHIDNNGKNIIDTASTIDGVNLHRRDLNVAPVYIGGIRSNTIFGGVFTPNDMAYRNPVFVNGWNTGNLTVTPDTTQTCFNQYSCANIPMWCSDDFVTFTAYLGGISYMIYDTATQQFVVGDHGMPLPFSNVISVLATDNYQNTLEFTQEPPDQPLMPGYLGANAQFFALPSVASYHQGFVDLNKVWPGGEPVTTTIGYMIGGIQSMGPTSGTTPKGHVNTYPNGVMYQVTLGPPPGAATAKKK